MWFTVRIKVKVLFGEAKRKRDSRFDFILGAATVVLLGFPRALEDEQRRETEQNKRNTYSAASSHMMCQFEAQIAVLFLNHTPAHAISRADTTMSRLIDLGLKETKWRKGERHLMPRLPVQQNHLMLPVQCPRLRD